MAIVNSAQILSSEELMHKSSAKCESVIMGEETKVDSVRNGTPLAGYTVITKSMIGAGMFSMAAGCADFGIILGVIFLSMAAAITWLSLRVLSILALDHSGSKPTFYSVSNAIVPKANWVIDVAVVINCTGGLIAFVQIFGALMSQGLMDVFHWDENALSLNSAGLIVQSVILLLLAPLCMMKEITSTKIPNMIGLASIAYIFLMTFFYTPCTEMSPELLKPGSIIPLFAAFPTFIFAYACQQNIFSIANEMKDVSLRKLNTVSIAAVLTGFAVYLPLMLFPFMTFGYNTESSYLYNLDSTKYPVVIGFILASLSVSISFVLLLHPVRNSLLSLFYRANQPTGKREVSIRIGLTVAIMGFSFGLAILLGKNLGLPINIAGLLGGNTMCFVMPFTMYLKKYGVDRKNRFSVAVLCTLVFCILLYPVCLLGIIYKQVNA